MNASAHPVGFGRLPLAALILSSVLLAFGPVLVRLADVGPVSAAFWRMALAAPVLLLAAGWAQRGRGLRLKALPWGLAILSGLFFAADLAAWHMGIVRTSVANATLFGNTAAFMLAGWSILVQGRHPGAGTLKALALALAGTLLLLGSSAQLSPRQLAGDALSLMAAAFYTGYLIVVMGLRGRLPTSVVLAMSTMASVAFLLPAALVEPGSVWPTDWRPVAALAITSQLAGQGLMVFASGRLPAPVIGVGLLVQPTVSAVAGWLLFGEVLGPPQLAGAAMVLVALGLIRR
jgi:drug/metabolite transporter (DMT)-like permease